MRSPIISIRFAGQLGSSIGALGTRRVRDFLQVRPTRLIQWGFWGFFLALSTTLAGQQEKPPIKPPDDAPAAAFGPNTPVLEADSPPAVLSPRGLEFRTPPMIGGGVWLAQGPGPALSGQVEGVPGGEVVGAVHALAAHPIDSDTLYLGGVNGGIWKTTDATAASPFWEPLTDSEASLSTSFRPTTAARPGPP